MNPYFGEVGGCCPESNFCDAFFKFKLGTVHMNKSIERHVRLVKKDYLLQTREDWKLGDRPTINMNSEEERYAIKIFLEKRQNNLRDLIKEDESLWEKELKSQDMAFFVERL
jgi:hypothetical protein